jgi:hypothetical protein
MAGDLRRTRENQTMELNAFESKILDALLDGADPVLEALRDQLKTAHVTQRDRTRVGEFLYLRVPEQTPRVVPSRFHLEDVTFDLEGKQRRGRGVLFVDDGHLQMLLCYLYRGSWPEDARLSHFRYYSQTPQRDLQGLKKLLRSRKEFGRES